MLDIQRPDLVAGVAGSGTMGRGIVQVLAQCGVRTLVFDAQPGAAAKAKEAIGKSLSGIVQKGRITQADADATLARIEVVDALAALKPCHVVVEAIVELLAPKQELFQALEKGFPRLASSPPTPRRCRSPRWLRPAPNPRASSATTSSIRCR